MLSLARQCEISRLKPLAKHVRLFSTSRTVFDDSNPKEDFRSLELYPKSVETSIRQKPPPKVAESREKTMATDQDWPSIWPTARTFHPHTVPLPLRQGYVDHPYAPSPDKYANAELMKIPNFLHLTPPAIKRHCDAIKKFCTEWPKALVTDEDCDRHFPVNIITSDYCYSSPTIREPLARIVTLKTKLSSLKLDEHAKDKLLRILGNRYDQETDEITIVADRCPTRKQNYEYALYLLIATYNEAWVVAPWEEQKAADDMENFDWDKSLSRERVVSIHKWPSKPDNFDYEDIPTATEYKAAVEELVNEGEDDNTLEKYKTAVLNFLNLRSTVIC